MKEGLFPLSSAQRTFWFLDQFEPNTPAYNLPRALNIRGQLNVEALREAFRALLSRHDVLRTRFVDLEGELFQEVVEDIDIDFTIRDLSGLYASERKMETLNIAAEEASKPFDLEHPPLLRLSLVRLGPEEHILVLVIHHIVIDGWSMSNLFKEIAQSYGQLAIGQHPKIAPLPLQYADFARWQNEYVTDEMLHEDVAYWRERLRGCPELLHLPGDRPRPAVQSHHGSIESFTIDETLMRRIKTMCAAEGVTFYMGLLAAFEALLWRYTGADDIPVGTPVAGRSDADLADLIGCFVNTLVMRGDLSGNPSFRELLLRTRTGALDAFTHQALPFERLLADLKRERSRSHTPLFQIMFILQNAPRQVVRLPGLLIEEVELDSRLAKFDLTLEIVENKGGGLYCQFEYSTDLFEQSTIERMARHFQNLLLSAVEDPASPISKLNMLSAPEQKQIIFDWNSAAVEYAKDLTIARAFEDQAQRSPDAIALRHGAQTLSYCDLDRRANQVASALSEKGIRPEMPVGIYMKRSIDAIVALLGVLKVGCPYVPLETSQPKHRLHLLITTCDCWIVLTHRTLVHDLPETDVILLDPDAALWSSQSRPPPPSLRTGQTPYIIFTSGSTGLPKGVAGTQRATMNRLEWMYRTYPFLPQEVCCQKTALSFVNSIWEIFGPLLRGIPNIIIPEEEVVDPELLLEQLARHRVTRIVLVPTLLRILLDHTPELGTRVPELKLWTVSGEYFPIDLAERFRAGFPEARLLNLYGSSEVAGDVTCYEVGELARLSAIAIGKPISNTQIYILDEFLQPLPIGVPGTLYVGGDCLAQGYWRQPELTRERFIPNPLDDRLGVVFATGDRARWLADGDIEYLGRLDTQIKIRGFRIELGEIEANLLAHPLIRQAVVIITGHTPEVAQLTAYVVCQNGAAPSLKELRGFLLARLPLYMVPAFFLELEEMPLLPSGKVDQRALPEPRVSTAIAGPAHIEPRNDVEWQLASIWRELLDIQQFGITDNFFDLGGNSLLAMRVLARVRRTFQVEVSIRSLFDGPTIEALGRAVEEAKASGVAPRLPPIVPRRQTQTGIDVLSVELRKLSPDQIERLLRQVRQGADATPAARDDTSPKSEP